MIGPAIACASSGRAPLMELMERSATGSTSTFHTSVVPTIHSARLHAAVDETPDGNAVASSSQWSASRTASATASFCFWVGDGSGDWATTLRARSVAKSQLIGPSCGCIRDWIWLKSAPRSGAPLPPKNCSNGVPLKGFWPPGRSLRGPRPGCCS